MQAEFISKRTYPQPMFLKNETTLLKNKLAFRQPLWIIKLTHFEYWPLWFLYLPLTPYIIWWMIKCRSFKYYYYSNPAIKTGGLDGESKKLVLDAIANKYKPRTILLKKASSLNEMIQTLHQNEITFPCIAKPDIGGMGKNVVIINSQQQLQHYASNSEMDFIVQEYIHHPIELGIFYHRYPGEQKGKITSITLKKFLSVTGDGISNVDALLKKSVRARFQLKRLRKNKSDLLRYTPSLNEEIIVEEIGNHCLGTNFTNGNHLINDDLTNVFDEISIPIKGFYFGRYDLRVSSIDDLYNGENISILELNGVGSIPTHIFDPDHKLLQAWRDILFHWKIAGEISLTNMKAGVKIFV